ncbi:MAG: hypothetical protein ACLR6B_08915 [Blautia sp.]
MRITKKPTIISNLKINGEWVRQENVPPEVVHRMVEEVMIRAGGNIGFDVTPTTKVKPPEGGVGRTSMENMMRNAVTTLVSVTAAALASTQGDVKCRVPGSWDGSCCSSS